MQIRKASKKDIESIVLIHKRCVEIVNSKFYPADVIQEWIKLITNDSVEEQFENSEWYVIDLKNKIIGFSQFSVNKGIIFQINIDPEFIGQGYGKKMFRLIEKLIKQNNKNEITLNATLNAVPFYEKLGFEKKKSIKFKLDKTEVKMVKMQKSLH